MQIRHEVGGSPMRRFLVFSMLACAGLQLTGILPKIRHFRHHLACVIAESPALLQYFHSQAESLVMSDKEWSGLMAAAQKGDGVRYRQLLDEIRPWLKRYFGTRLPPAMTSPPSDVARSSAAAMCSAAVSVISGPTSVPSSNGSPMGSFA